MQKKLIALAIASLVAAPAFAQSNVTIYGLVDVGYTWRGDNVDDNIGSMQAINSGQASGSRLGFKGTEDLGNGLKALFTIEAGFTADDGRSAQGGRAWGRQTFAGLTGNSWGTVIFGRFNTPQYNLWINTDPFGTGMVGQSTNLYAQYDPVTGKTNSTFAFRLDSTVAYVTPTWAGFNVTAAYSTNADGNETLGNDNDNYVWAISPVYNNGPLMVGVNYHEIKYKSLDNYKLKNWDVGATYDFKFLKLALGYNNQSDNGDVDLIDRDTWMIGVTVPIGKASILASYNDLDDGTDANQDAHQWAIGAVYPFSKRTDVYAAYADVSNKNGGMYSAGDAGNDGRGYQQGAQIGIRHRF